MKKFILSILAIAAMASCTKTSEDDVDPNVPVEIKFGSLVSICYPGLPSLLTEAVILYQT